MARIDLGGSWSLIRKADGSRRRASMPGDIISALVAAGELADPYRGRAELEAQWVGREDWVLEREFSIDAGWLGRRDLFIEIEALDTVAEISLNGRVIGTSSDMFTRLRLPVAKALKTGVNLLSILLRSPEKLAAKLAEDLPYPVPASVYPVTSPHRNLLRKIQCMSGWDWGPCLMTGGIYDGIALVGLDAPRIDYVRTTTTRKGEGRWELEVLVDFSAQAAGRASFAIELGGAKAVKDLVVGEGEGQIVLGLELEGIKDWWPAGYGNQPLYELVVRSEAGPGEADRLVKRLGFREVEVLAKADPVGRSFTFKVNGLEIFAKGANWIPADALPSRWNRERLADLLGSAREAHMNMLKVWGGGRYESDDFYGLCDELGLLVWQDAAFSCALYPSTPSFLRRVEGELRHQVRRLADHPSLALWCGNNEALGAIAWYEESKAAPARYIVDYDRLNEGTVGRVIRELDPSRTFWPSSPSAGPQDFSDNWHADTRGDMHYWSVWHEGRPFSAYLDVSPRFCSEFGFQSFPSLRTAKSFAPESELNITSPTFEHHQRHPRGNTIIIETMSRYFRMPRGFRETLWLSQVQQALAIRTAVEYWRAQRPRCMGTLYWQLNDVWPAASWSSLEHDGSWKLLHHEARRFYDPVHICLFVKDGVVHAVGVNDGDRHLFGVLSIRLRRFDGELAMDLDTDGDLQPRSATLLWKAALRDLPIKPEEVYLAARYEASQRGKVAYEPALVFGVPSRSGGKAEVVRRNQLFLAEPKRCALGDPRISETWSEDGSGPILKLRSEAPAFWVTPEVDGIPGRWEDAGFYMLNNEERSLRFVPARGQSMPSLAELRAATKVMHLRGSYD